MFLVMSGPDNSAAILQRARRNTWGIGHPFALAVAARI